MPNYNKTPYKRSWEGDDADDRSSTQTQGIPPFRLTTTPGSVHFRGHGSRQLAEPSLNSYLSPPNHSARQPTYPYEPRSAMTTSQPTDAPSVWHPEQRSQDHHDEKRRHLGPRTSSFVFQPDQRGQGDRGMVGPPGLGEYWEGGRTLPLPAWGDGSELNADRRSPGSSGGNPHASYGAGGYAMPRSGMENSEMIYMAPERAFTSGLSSKFETRYPGTRSQPSHEEFGSGTAQDTRASALPGRAMRDFSSVTTTLNGRRHWTVLGEPILDFWLPCPAVDTELDVCLRVQIVCALVLEDIDQKVISVHRPRVNSRRQEVSFQVDAAEDARPFVRARMGQLRDRLPESPALAEFRGLFQRIYQIFREVMRGNLEPCDQLSAVDPNSAHIYGLSRSKAGLYRACRKVWMEPQTQLPYMSGQTGPLRGYERPSIADSTPPTHEALSAPERSRVTSYGGINSGMDSPGPWAGLSCVATQGGVRRWMVLGYPLFDLHLEPGYDCPDQNLSLSDLTRKQLVGALLLEDIRNKILVVKSSSVTTEYEVKVRVKKHHPVSKDRVDTLCHHGRLEQAPITVEETVTVAKAVFELYKSMGGEFNAEDRQTWVPGIFIDAEYLLRAWSDVWWSIHMLRLAV